MKGLDCFHLFLHHVQHLLNLGFGCHDSAWTVLRTNNTHTHLSFLDVGFTNSVQRHIRLCFTKNVYHKNNLTYKHQYYIQERYAKHAYPNTTYAMYAVMTYTTLHVPPPSGGWSSTCPSPIWGMVIYQHPINDQLPNDTTFSRIV